MNLNLESSTYENNNQINFNSSNNNNIPFDNTNYAINSYKHLKNNRTTRNDNMKRIFDEKFSPSIFSWYDFVKLREN